MSDQEIIRKQNLYDRINTIYERDLGFPAFYLIIKNQPNWMSYMKELIEDPERADEAESLVLQMEIKDVELTNEENANAYKALRKAEYGDIGDQLDEIFWNMDAWKARIKSIKDKYPKE